MKLDEAKCHDSRSFNVIYRVGDYIWNNSRNIRGKSQNLSSIDEKLA